MGFSPFSRINKSGNFTDFLSRLFFENIDVSVFYREIKYFFRGSAGSSSSFWRELTRILSSYFRIFSSYFCSLICFFRFFIISYYAVVFFFYFTVRILWLSACFFYITIWVSVFYSFFSVSCALIWLVYTAANRIFIIYSGFFIALSFASL
jgi:hypothetical protein